ncbi:MAG: ABC transporter permease, partial [Treponema sp.]|nr:ABC transporter permease [Treponema sp.]
MSPLVLVRTAWKALRRNISRSLLTMLGIIIGVGAVISSMAIGAGAQAAVLKQIETLGANLVVITPGSMMSGGVQLGSGTRTTLQMSDVAAIAANVPEISAVTPYSQTAAQVIGGGLNWSTTIAGTKTSYRGVGN